MPRRRACRPIVAALLLLAGMLTASGPRARAQGAPAHAVSPAVLDTTPRSPAQDGRTGGLYRLETAVLPPDGVLLVSFGAEQYGIEYPPLGAEPLAADLRDLRLRVAYGALPGLRLSADVASRSWSGPAGLLPSNGGGLADGRLRLVGRLPSPNAALALALVGETTLPLGSRDDGLGEGRAVASAGATATLRLWRASRYPELRVHLGAARRWNPDNGRGATGEGSGDGLYAPWPPLYPAVSAGGAPGDNDFWLWGAGVELHRDDVSLFVEYTEARLPLASGAAVREFARFITPGLHWGRGEGWGLSFAYDVCLSLDDPATPFVPARPDLVWHAAVSRGFTVGGRDRDGDGVPDRRDGCPGAAEDRDGWRDGDGCPDLDNDGDGVPDLQDAAPNRAEDRDGFADEDGVPDPDNDGDGIADVRDACPDAAEDFDGDRDGDGCPEEMLDRDQDGVADENDHCPALQEDRDGFEDNDGCPDPDNDLDGIDDTRDRCPDQAEDYNGVADDDGCPDGQGSQAAPGGPPVAPSPGTAPPDSSAGRS